MAKTTALLDACVLYPAPLRDLLMNLAVDELFDPKWTDAIHEEWIRNLVANRPDLSRRQLERTRNLIDRAAPEARVTGYEMWIKHLVLPDPDDRHVLAAAIESGAELIVTYNIKHFPRRKLEESGLKVIHPDAFAMQLLADDETAFCSAVKPQRENLRNPPKAADEFLWTLELQGLEKTVAVLRRSIESV